MKILSFTVGNKCSLTEICRNVKKCLVITDDIS